MKYQLINYFYLMDLYSFHRQSTKRRAMFIVQQGMFLATCTKEDFVFSLYHMHTFYAEVWYLPGEDRLGMVRGFKGVKQLDPYLEDIDLEELMR